MNNRLDYFTALMFKTFVDDGHDYESSIKLSVRYAKKLIKEIDKPKKNKVKKDK